MGIRVWGCRCRKVSGDNGVSEQVGWLYMLQGPGTSKEPARAWSGRYQAQGSVSADLETRCLFSFYSLSGAGLSGAVLWQPSDAQSLQYRWGTEAGG